MDKNAIKKFAVWARRELIARVSQKAEQYGITEEHHGDAYAERIGEQLLTRTEQNQRKNLITRIEQEGYQQVMEEVAYTWFNRFIALRFMEVNNYLPTRIRVFTDEENAFKPQILAEAIHMEMDGLDMDKVYQLKSDNKTEELYKYLLITQCNALSSILPGMFQRISDYTELLFPDNLLREGSVIEQMVSLIPESDWQDQVQIIGWLYQYYNTEPKDQVFANLKKNIKISKHDIPAATQLFTPDWIVRYMVENSLGRLWVEGHPDEALKSNWKYYLEEAEQEPEVQAQLAEIRREYAGIKPEDIKCIDPCMGSGHILCYLFDVLVQIYEAYGYSTREAVQSIVENNLYGLDIDDRAAQLAYFAVMMKARQYDRRFFTRGIQPHVMAIQESNTLEAFAHLRGQLSLDTMCLETANQLIRTFRDAKEYGSILEVDIPTLETADRLMEQIHAINGDFELMAWIAEAEELLPELAKQAAIMQQKFDVVVTNPPYMADSGMAPSLLQYVKQNFPEYRTDLYSCFMGHIQKVLKSNGISGMMTSYTWMFLSAFADARKAMLTRMSLLSLIQPEYHAFFQEAFVPICTFVFRNSALDYSGQYIKLDRFYGADIQSVKVLEAIKNPKCGYMYTMNQTRYLGIPGSPIAYWLKESTVELFTNTSLLSEMADMRQGLITGDNERFLRQWSECNRNNISSSCERTKKWFFYHKGGEYRKWYGNITLVVNWENDGHDIINFVDSKGKQRSRPQNVKYYLREGFTWTALTVADFNVRYMPVGGIFDAKGSSGFALCPEKLPYYIALCNSKVAMEFLSFLAPTMDYSAGAVGKIPCIVDESAKQIIEPLVVRNIELSRSDWDSFETSWDFQQHPFLRYRIPEPVWGDVSDEEAWKNISLDLSYNNWKQVCETRFQQLKANEEELNRIFIDIYGLQDELTPEVEDKDVTVRRADLGRDIRSFISYAVGCMFGRYSLSKPGLAFAGGEWDAGNYTSDFQPDKDGILPITDDEYFGDDIVNRFVRFVEVAFGKNTLEENLAFIAKALGGTGTPRDVIRSYFLNDFYADHLKIYQKRPIYWLFDSGKKNGFKALIYMHRYAPDTIARIRTDYVHEQQSRYRTAIADLENRIISASTAERVKLNKQLTKVKAQAEELRLYEEKIHHLADQMISIDLDDGVKVNYAKFADVLAKIK